VAVRRRGELSERVLQDALADEGLRGARPMRLVVGSDALAQVAHRILDPRGLGALVSSMPNVEVDQQLADDEWELREAAT
jgi:hypothetical protein